MSTQDSIILKGCRQHNLKNLSLSIPKYAITVITGISGSGKSSLAFDTLFAEGQRRYLAHLSPEARTLIKQVPKPDVDLIEGLAPTLAINQGRHSLYARGTVSTYTDIYDLLSLLFANIGEQHSPETGKRLIRYSRQEIIELILKEYPDGTRFQLLAPVKLKRENPEQAISRLQQMGFVRFKIQDEDWATGEPLPSMDSITAIDVIIDRLEMREGLRDRLAHSVETALDLSQGILKVMEGRAGAIRFFTEIYVCPETGLSFAPLKVNDFNFNSPHGACPICGGLGGKEIQTSTDEDEFTEWQNCPSCHGARLKPESLACLIKGKNIDQYCSLTVLRLLEEIDSWKFRGKEKQIANEIIPSITTRLKFLEQVGLGYLELNRKGKTLSDGEAQRVQLASQIGAKLSGLIYILDEPSLGLHRQDIKHLQKVIKELKELDNTVILVEHERGLISQADHLVELGPGAGEHGGKLLFEGTYADLLKDPHSPTGQWLSGKIKMSKPPKRKSTKHWLTINKVSLHNLNQFSAKIPLGCLVGFCGVSGSGKSSLVIDLIGEQIRRNLFNSTPIPGLADPKSIQRLVMSEKQSIRYSARSIPATYVGLMTPLRQLFAETRLAKARGYTTSRFSLNRRGGRCEACEGLGRVRVNMQLMPDLFIPCEVCLGQRYNHETLQVTWENLNISQVLNLPVEEAAKVFDPIPMIASKLKLMRELGLGYLTLGQPFNTLSTGEIQRLKLVADLADPSTLPTLYILDEPSAGLHFQDIQKLMSILHKLVDKGHSVFVIEHHLEILKQADWLLELGPGAGPAGGQLIFEGTADKLEKADTPTGRVMLNNITNLTNYN